MSAASTTGDSEPQTLNKKLRRVVCRLCKEKGKHIARDCPENPNNKEKEAKASTTVDNTEPLTPNKNLKRALICRSCNKEGHKWSICPDLKNKKLKVEASTTGETEPENLDNKISTMESGSSGVKEKTGGGKRCECCDAVDHIARFCPNSRKNKKNKVQASTTGETKTPTPIEKIIAENQCRYCGVQGHFIGNCPVKNWGKGPEADSASPNQGGSVQGIKMEPIEAPEWAPQAPPSPMSPAKSTGTEPANQQLPSGLPHIVPGSAVSLAQFVEPNKGRKIPIEENAIELMEKQALLALAALEEPLVIKRERRDSTETAEKARQSPPYPLTEPKPAQIEPKKIQPRPGLASSRISQGPPSSPALIEATPAQIIQPQPRPGPASSRISQGPPSSSALTKTKSAQMMPKKPQPHHGPASSRISQGPRSSSVLIEIKPAQIEPKNPQISPCPASSHILQEPPSSPALAETKSAQMVPKKPQPYLGTASSRISQGPPSFPALIETTPAQIVQPQPRPGPASSRISQRPRSSPALIEVKPTQIVPKKPQIRPGPASSHISQEPPSSQASTMAKPGPIVPQKPQRHPVPTSSRISQGQRSSLVLIEVKSAQIIQPQPRPSLASSRISQGPPSSLSLTETKSAQMVPKKPQPQSGPASSRISQGPRSSSVLIEIKPAQIEPKKSQIRPGLASSHISQEPPSSPALTETKSAQMVPKKPQPHPGPASSHISQKPPSSQASTMANPAQIVPKKPRPRTGPASLFISQGPPTSPLLTESKPAQIEPKNPQPRPGPASSLMVQGPPPSQASTMAKPATIVPEHLLRWAASLQEPSSTSKSTKAKPVQIVSGNPQPHSGPTPSRIVQEAPRSLGSTTAKQAQIRANDSPTPQASSSSSASTKAIPTRITSKDSQSTPPRPQALSSSSASTQAIPTRITSKDSQPRTAQPTPLIAPGTLPKPLLPHLSMLCANATALSVKKKRKRRGLKRNGGSRLPDGTRKPSYVPTRLLAERSAKQAALKEETEVKSETPSAMETAQIATRPLLSPAATEATTAQSVPKALQLTTFIANQIEVQDSPPSPALSKAKSTTNLPKQPLPSSVSSPLRIMQGRSPSMTSTEERSAQIVPKIPQPPDQPTKAIPKVLQPSTMCKDPQPRPLPKDPQPSTMPKVPQPSPMPKDPQPSSSAPSRIEQVPASSSASTEAKSTGPTDSQPSSSTTLTVPEPPSLLSEPLLKPPSSPPKLITRVNTVVLPKKRKRRGLKRNRGHRLPDGTRGPHYKPARLLAEKEARMAALRRQEITKPTKQNQQPLQGTQDQERETPDAVETAQIATRPLSSPAATEAITAQSAPKALQTTTISAIQCVVQDSPRSPALSKAISTTILPKQPLPSSFASPLRIMQGPNPSTTSTVARSAQIVPRNPQPPSSLAPQRVTSDLTQTEPTKAIPKVPQPSTTCKDLQTCRFSKDLQPSPMPKEPQPSPMSKYSQPSPMPKEPQPSPMPKDPQPSTSAPLLIEQVPASSSASTVRPSTRAPLHIVLGSTPTTEPTDSQSSSSTTPKIPGPPSLLSEPLLEPPSPPPKLITNVYTVILPNKRNRRKGRKRNRGHRLPDGTRGPHYKPRSLAEKEARRAALRSQQTTELTKQNQQILQETQDQETEKTAAQKAIQKPGQMTPNTGTSVGNTTVGKAIQNQNAELELLNKKQQEIMMRQQEIREQKIMYTKMLKAQLETIPLMQNPPVPNVQYPGLAGVPRTPVPVTIVNHPNAAVKISIPPGQNPGGPVQTRTLAPVNMAQTPITRNEPPEQPTPVNMMHHFTTINHYPAGVPRSFLNPIYQEHLNQHKIEQLGLKQQERELIKQQRQIEKAFKKAPLLLVNNPSEQKAETSGSVPVNENSRDGDQPQSYSPSDTHGDIRNESGSTEPHEGSESPDPQGTKRLSAFKRLGPVTAPKKPKLTINLKCNTDQAVREVVDESEVEFVEEHTPVHLRQDVTTSTDEIVMKYLIHWPWKKHLPVRRTASFKTSKSAMLLEQEQMEEAYDKDNIYIQITVTNYPKHWTKEELFDVFLDQVNVIPCFIEFTSRECKFLVVRCKPALLAIHKMGFKLRKEDIELNLTISITYVTQNQIDFVPRLVLRKRLSMGYNGEGKLDLQEFTLKSDVSHFIYYPLRMLSHQRDLVQLQSVIEWDRLTELNLSHNRLTSIDGFHLNETTPHLRKLDLSYNHLEKVTVLLRCRNLPLNSISLEGNPLCHDYIDPAEYVKVVRMLFPAIRELDGVKIQLKGDLPTINKNYCIYESQKIVEKFLETFYPLLEAQPADRLLIDEMYDEDALMTVIYKYKYLHRQFRISSINSHFIDDGVKDIVEGASAITKYINKWPGLNHDPFTFSVDVLFHSDATTVIKICGILKLTSDTLAEDEPVISFSRTTLLHTKDGVEYKILNELLLWDEPSNECHDNAFQITKIRSKKLYIDLEFDSDPDEESKKKLIEIFGHLTELDRNASRRCLEKKEWNLRTALDTFIQLLKLNDLSSINAWGAPSCPIRPST